MPALPGSGLFRDLAAQAGRGLLDALFPMECVTCGASGNVICDKCAADLPLLLPPFCSICSAPGDFARCERCAASERWFDGIRAPYRYAGPIRQAILALKYGGVKAGSAQLGDLLAAYLDDNPLPGDAIVPVPMHRSRRRERGYNQAELLARRMAQRGTLRYQDNVLIRTRHADPQAGITDPTLRASNIAGSIAVAPGVDASGGRFILIDDVATTGSTLSECAAALKKAGAESVWCLTLAVASGQGAAE